MKIKKNPKNKFKIFFIISLIVKDITPQYLKEKNTETVIAKNGRDNNAMLERVTCSFLSP